MSHVSEGALPAVVRPPTGLPPVTVEPDGPILLRVPNWIGDAVLALPAVATLAEAFRERTVVVAARRGIAPLYVGQKGVTDVVLVAERGPGRLTALRRALAERPALAVVFPPSLSAAAEVAVARPRAAWGYGDALRWMALDVRLPRRWARGRHRWEAFAILAAAVTGQPVVERYPIVTAAGDVAAADRLFAEAGLVEPGARVVGLVPGSRASSRRWPAEGFVALASVLGREGARVVLLGSAAESGITARIAALADPTPVDWAGRTTLPVLAECFRRLDHLVTNDTGPMHLAAAVGTPLVVPWGAGDERVTSPRGARSTVLVHPIHCRPCVKNRCAYNLGCLTGIPVEAALGPMRSSVAS